MLMNYDIFILYFMRISKCSFMKCVKFPFLMCYALVSFFVSLVCLVDQLYYIIRVMFMLNFFSTNKLIDRLD